MNHSTDSESSAALTTLRPTISTWFPDLRLHTSLVASVQRFINRIPARHLELLQQNDLFGNSEGADLKLLTQSGISTETSSSLSLGCHCGIMCRYALPCRHILHWEGFSIPLSLIHPQWC